MPNDDLNHQLGIEEEAESPEPDNQVFSFDSDGTALVPKAAPGVLEGLSNQLVWKIGKEEISERIFVRVGYASATSSFRELPRLRGATDLEIAEAARNNELVVEWIE